MQPLFMEFNQDLYNQKSSKRYVQKEFVNNPLKIKIRKASLSLFPQVIHLFLAKQKNFTSLYSLLLISLKNVKKIWDLGDKTMANKFMYNEDTQNYPFCKLQLVVETFEHST